MATQRQKRVLYLASRNRHKLEELREIIGTDLWEVHLAADLDPDIGWVEDGKTFIDNAVIKAMAVKRLTSACVLADDSGLEVSALAGKPGVYSQRFAGPTATDQDNNKKLLQELATVPEKERTARFVCALAFIDEEGHLSTFEDRCEGTILCAAKGQGGFGYDPLFFVPPLGKSFAELSTGEKNAMSHRSRALAQWSRFLSRV